MDRGIELLRIRIELLRILRAGVRMSPTALARAMRLETASPYSRSREPDRYVIESMLAKMVQAKLIVPMTGRPWQFSLSDIALEMLADAGP